jgi:hypothetical protein
MNGTQWTKPEIALLGTAPDSKVAKRIRRTKYAVQRMRVKLNIAACRLEAAWSSQELALLGKVSDKQVAKSTGRTLVSVRQKRALLGIRPWSPFVDLPGPKPSTTFGLPISLLRRLKAAAKQQSCPMSVLVRRLLDDGLRAYESVTHNQGTAHG